MAPLHVLCLGQPKYKYAYLKLSKYNSWFANEAAAIISKCFVALLMKLLLLSKSFANEAAVISWWLSNEAAAISKCFANEAAIIINQVFC